MIGYLPWGEHTHACIERYTTHRNRHKKKSISTAEDRSSERQVDSEGRGSLHQGNACGYEDLQSQHTNPPKEASKIPHRASSGGLHRPRGLHQHGATRRTISENSGRSTKNQQIAGKTTEGYTASKNYSKEAESRIKGAEGRVSTESVESCTESCIEDTNEIYTEIATKGCTESCTIESYTKTPARSAYTVSKGSCNKKTKCSRKEWRMTPTLRSASTHVRESNTYTEPA